MSGRKPRKWIGLVILLVVVLASLGVAYMRMNAKPPQVDESSLAIVSRGDLARSVVVWKWNGFGFSLEWRSPPGRLRRLWLTNVQGDSILDIVAR